MTQTAPLEEKTDFYSQTLRHLTDNGVPFMIGGSWAVHLYTGIVPRTKDLDVFCTAQAYPRILKVLEDAGYQIEIRNPSWLAKACLGDDFVDIIWNDANLLTPVDDSWFEHAPTAELFGAEVRVVPPVELIWTKSYVITKSRCDVPDVLHVMLKTGDELDWQRLLNRMESAWEVLFADILLFWYVYPAQRHLIPDWLIDHLVQSVQAAQAMPKPTENVTRGLYLSKSDFRVDFEWGFDEP